MHYLHNHILPTHTLHTTSLCCVCIACSLHCITFKISGILPTCDWKFLGVCPLNALDSQHISGGQTLALERASIDCVLYYPLLSGHPQGKAKLQNKSFLTIIPAYPYIVLPVEFTCRLGYFFQGRVLWRQRSSRVLVSIQQRLSQLCPVLLQPDSAPQTFSPS